MLRRGLSVLIVFLAVAAWLAPVGPTATPALAIPVANNDTTYGLYGRVFPDPQGCLRGKPGASPWAKGKVCATEYLQWNETLAGLRYLAGKYPRYAQLVNLRDLKDTVPEFANLDMQSAGLPQADLSRDRRDLHVFVVTDRESPVARADRHRYAYSLSMHGIERAGIEGGVRAAEELVTWAATAPNTPILEPTKSGPTAGEVLKQNVLYFVLSNPDGWARGEITKGGVYFQRYNGNGTDVNREFPAVGYANPVYTPFAEPEATGYAAYLLREKEAATAKQFRGSLDLHGMGAADSFSYTLLSGTAKTWATNTQVVHQAEAIYADAVKRLSWSQLIAPPEDCPGNVPVFLFVTAGSVPMCPDQWGSVWDTIDYQTTGSIGDWMSSDIGLGAIGVDNEMAYSHLVPNTLFVPELEQLHVDGNKGIIYAQLAALTNPRPVPPVDVRAAYAPSVQRKVRAASAVAAQAALPTQAPIQGVEVAGSGFEFAVKGPDQGVRNGGMQVQFTFTNIDGISFDSLSSVVLERFGPEHAGDAEGWQQVGRWYRQEPTYAPAGARIDLNEPAPGRYRLAPSPLARHGVTKVNVTFTAAKTIPEPNLAYDVANTDVFKQFDSIRAITPADVLRNPRALDAVSAYVLADDPAPGVAAADRAAWFAALKGFTSRGGTLVLTDNALSALVDLGVVPAKAVVPGVEYGGWISFTDKDDKPTLGKVPLNAALDRAGAASGSGEGLELRRQTYDPGAVGFPIRASTGGSCASAGCFAPQTIVDTEAWIKAGGSIAGRAAVVPKTAKPGAGGNEPIGVVYGEAPLGQGRVRIVGGLLPTPTEANYHPYGLEGYALSWTGWQVLVNVLSVGAPAPVPASVAGVSIIPRTGADATVALDLAAVAIALAACARGLRRRATA